MKVIGFLQNHDPYINCSKSIEDLIDPNILNNPQDIDIIIDYLKSGVVILKLLTRLYDDDGDLIGPSIIYSDGEWVWPSYYSFYLKKHNDFKIPLDFFNHCIKSNRLKSIRLSDTEKKYCEFMIYKLTNVKIENHFIPENVKLLISQKGTDIKCY